MPFSTKEAKKAYNKLYYQANKCEHGKEKNRCKECKGSDICDHNKRKSRCKECKGSEICEHDKQKNLCKECKGSQICEHDKRKYFCKECEGNGICEHNKRKNRCKECLSVNKYLVMLQRNSLNRIIKLTNITKTKPSIEYLSCSAEYFKDYIEKKMIGEMNWENIHLDHIKPISKFTLDDIDEFLDCCHYSNFQPLLASQNLSKSNKWNECDEIFWNENIKGKEYMELYIPN